MAKPDNQLQEENDSKKDNEYASVIALIKKYVSDAIAELEDSIDNSRNNSEASTEMLNKLNKLDEFIQSDNPNYINLNNLVDDLDDAANKYMWYKANLGSYNSNANGRIIAAIKIKKIVGIVYHTDQYNNIDDVQEFLKSYRYENPIFVKDVTDRYDAHLNNDLKVVTDNLAEYQLDNTKTDIYKALQNEEEFSKFCTSTDPDGNVKKEDPEEVRDLLNKANSQLKTLTTKATSLDTIWVSADCAKGKYYRERILELMKKEHPEYQPFMQTLARDGSFADSELYEQHKHEFKNAYKLSINFPHEFLCGEFFYGLPFSNFSITMKRHYVSS